MAGLIQTFKNLGDGIARRFSHTDKAILNTLDGVKLTDCTDGQLKSTLSYCCIMVGIERVPGDDAKMVILSYLRKYHGSLTSRQVAQAFELLASGEHGNQAPEHYNNLSPKYISDVLRLYTHRMRQVVDKVRSAEINAAPATKSTNEQYYDRLVKVVDKYKVIPLLWAWEEVYTHLQDIGKMPAGKTPSPENCKQNVINWIKEQFPNVLQQKLNNSHHATR